MSSKVAIKTHRQTLDISANNRITIDTNTTFFTRDIGTARKILTITDDGKPLDLTDSLVVIGFDYRGDLTDIKRKIIDSDDESIIFTNAEKGELELFLPNHLFNYSGEVLVHVFVKYPDGRESDAGIIQTRFQESWLDRELPEMDDFYVKRFEDLAEEIRQKALEITAEMNKELDTVKKDLTNAQGDINSIQKQIKDNDIVTKNEVDSAGFGENNLIRNATEPIIINPAGDLTNAWQYITQTPLNHEIDYSISFIPIWLRGGATRVNVRLVRSTSDSLTLNVFAAQEHQVPIIDGKCTLSFKTPSLNPATPYLYLIANAGATTADNQGNTLQLTNIMLTIGTKSQPYRPAHEDDKERLDAIETLKPNIKRTVATFEGVTNRPYENGGHFASSNMSNQALLAPSSAPSQFNDTNYETISKINERAVTLRNVVVDSVAQVFFRFDILKHIERNYSTAIWQGHTALADKVRIARQICKGVACVWDGFGLTNNTPWVALTRATSLTSWASNDTPITHSNSITQRLTRRITSQTGLNASILSDGTVRFIVHTAEGQTTPIGGATLTTAFVQFEVDVELTLAHTDWSYSKAEVDGQLLGHLPLTGGTLTGDLTARKINVRSRNGGAGEAQIDMGLTSEFSTRLFAKITNDRTHFGMYDLNRDSTWLSYRGDLGTSGRVAINGVDVTLSKTLSVSDSITAPRFIGTADTASKLQSTRPFALTGAIEGTATSDLTNGVTINTSQRRVRVSDWDNINPTTLGLRNGDSINIYGDGTASNQPLETLSLAWSGTLECITSSANRYLLTIKTDIGRQVVRQYWGTWGAWQPSNTQVTSTSNATGQYQSSTKLTQTGTATITPTPNIPTSVRINFPKGYRTIPNVQVTSASANVGTEVRGASHTNLTTTGFDLVITRTSSIGTGVHWSATGVTT